MLSIMYIQVLKYEIYTKTLLELLDSRIPSSRLNGQQLNISTLDTESLLSICPSEPGMHNKASSYQSSEDGGSVEDLIDVERLLRLRQAGVSASPLVPTTSLPNLRPYHGDVLRFPTGSLSPSPLREDFASSTSYLASFGNPMNSNQNNSNNGSTTSLRQQHLSFRLQKRVNAVSCYFSSVYVCTQ